MLEAINNNIANSQAAQIQASEKTRKLWESRKERAENLLEVFATAGKDDALLSSDEKAKRDEYLKKAKELWEVKVRKILVTLDREMVGPFALGTLNALISFDYISHRSLLRRPDLRCRSPPCTLVSACGSPLRRKRQRRRRCRHCEDRAADRGQLRAPEGLPNDQRQCRSYACDHAWCEEGEASGVLGRDACTAELEEGIW